MARPASNRAMALFCLTLVVLMVWSNSLAPASPRVVVTARPRLSGAAAR